VFQCVAVCCSVLQCVVVCCSVLQCVAVCCSLLQCVANAIFDILTALMQNTRRHVLAAHVSISLSSLTHTHYNTQLTHTHYNTLHTCSLPMCLSLSPLFHAHILTKMRAYVSVSLSSLSCTHTHKNGGLCVCLSLFSHAHNVAGY